MPKIRQEDRKTKVVSLRFTEREWEEIRNYQINNTLNSSLSNFCSKIVLRYVDTTNLFGEKK